MTNAFIAALLLNFAAFAGAIVMRRPQYDYSEVTRLVAPFLIPLATLAGFGAMLMELQSKGARKGGVE